MPYLLKHIDWRGVKIAAGTKVDIVGDHYDIMIIKDEKNQRCFVRVTELSDEPPDVIPPAPAEIPETKKSKNKRGSRNEPENTLF